MNAGRKSPPQPQARRREPCQRPTQSLGPGVVQPKAAAPKGWKAPSAPPVYRPQPPPKCLQPKAAPGGLRPPVQSKPAAVGAARRPEPRPAPVGARANACVQPKARPAAAPAFKANRTSAVIQRMEGSSTSAFDDFIKLAWGAVKIHWQLVEETDPHAVEDTRTQSTGATFTREGFGPETGKNTATHAEWTPVDRFYVSFPEIFPGIVRGGQLECAGNKATCFLCSAIAHTLGIKIQKKDSRGYTGHYALPGFMMEDKILSYFVGPMAFEYYEKAGRPIEWLRKLPGELYKRNKGEGKNFNV